MKTVILGAAGILAAGLSVGTAAAGPNDGSTGPWSPTPPRTELLEPSRQVPETTGRAVPATPDTPRGSQPQPDTERPLPIAPPDRTGK